MQESQVKATSGRPWSVAPENYGRCITDLFPKWLKERGGVVVYENHVMDSSCLGDRTFMPARFIAEDDQMHDAPKEHRPNGGVPSMRQQKVDHIKLEDFTGVEEALKCFVQEVKMFEMQIKIDDKWVSINATNAKEPYQYETRQDAERMLDICYPDQRREDRLDGAHNQCRVVEKN